MASRHVLMWRNLLPSHSGGGTDTSGHPRRTQYYGWVLMVVLGITTIIPYGTTRPTLGFNISLME